MPLRTTRNHWLDRASATADAALRADAAPPGCCASALQFRFGPDRNAMWIHPAAAASLPPGSYRHFRILLQFRQD